jgi:lipopolysaccharide export system protein LptA
MGMSTLVRRVFESRVVGTLALLALVWGGTGVVHGQERPDTTRAGGPPATAVPPAPLDTVRASDVSPADTSAPERALVRADSLSALTREGERLQELFGNVRVRQDTTRLRSRYGVRYLNRDELLFTGDVVIYERGDTLRADTVWYNKRTKVGRARSNVRLTDGEVVVRAPEARYYTDEKRSVFPDSVTLVDSSRVLRAQEGTYWSDARRAEFQGAVTLTDPDTYLESDSLTYYRDQERSIATGSVFIRRVDEGETAADTAAVTYLFGEWADNQEQTRYSRVERRALLVRVRMDSTGAPEDTLAVRARRLEARRTDTYRRLVAVDSVRIWQADLAAVADSAVYDRVVAAGRHDTTAAPAPLPEPTGGPSPDADDPNAPLDSLVARAEPVDAFPDSGASAPSPVRRDTAATDTATAAAPDTTRRRAADSLATDRSAEKQKASAWATPFVRSEEELPLEETRLFRAPITWFERTQVWGDSIRVRARNRSLDTVYVRGSAFAAQLDTTVDRIRQLKGKDITAFFRRDSLQKIRARPNGQAIYFSAAEDGTLNGATRASSDVVEIRFANGDVKQITFGRGVQGEAYHKKEYIPDPFRLEGFQWTPERRPTRARLLREERVRNRLDLGPPGPPERERPPVARAPPDSVGRREYGAVPGAPDASPPSAVPSPPQGMRKRPLPDSLARPPDSLRPPRPAPPPSDTSDTPTDRP